MKITAGLVFLFVSFSALAESPTCHTHANGSYCKYTGLVERIYVNDANVILFYFENKVDVSVPEAVGINITQGSAAAVSINTYPEFAKLFYSTALAAQASGRKVTIHMRGTLSGYLRADRIWLSAP